MSSNTGDKFLYFLVGASIGSVVALLFAPQSGRETRDDISKRANEGRDYVNKKVEEGRHFVDESKRRVGEEVTSLAERAKGEVGTLVEKGRTTVQRQKEQFAAAFEAGKDAYLEDKETAD